MRPRKPDGKLSRHGLGARRVALLAPRGDLGKYRHPLGYVGAITKILVKLQSKSRILGDGKPILSGGGVPKFGVPAKYHSEARTLCGVSVRRGSLTSMLGDGSLFSSTGTTLTPSECYLSFRLTDSEGAATKARGGQAAGFSSRT